MFHSGNSNAGRTRTGRAIVNRRRRPASLGVALAALTGLMAFDVACGHRGRRNSYIDLIHLLPGAQKRSVLAADRAFQLVAADVGGDVKPGIRTCGASRIIWTVRLPDNPVLRTAIAVDRTDSAGAGPIAFRIGIGARHYERLFLQEFPAPAGPSTDARWQAVSISLRAYQGWKWSVFYRPSSIDWPVIFSLDTAVSADGMTECGYWAVPRIESVR